MNRFNLNDHKLTGNGTASCFVCGTDVRDGWFAEMNTGHQTVFLCSAMCARMFFEVEPPPAHDHRARHNFQRARAAIVDAARSALECLK